MEKQLKERLWKFINEHNPELMFSLQENYSLTPYLTDAIREALTFGISVFDGFHHAIAAWFARYINEYLWLPVTIIFGCSIGRIQEKMLQVDMEQIQTYQDIFFSDTDVAYLIFLTIGIIGYFTVPSVANAIVQASVPNTLTSKVNSLVNSTTRQLYNSTLSMTAIWAAHTSRNWEKSSYRKNANDSYEESYLKDKIQNQN